MDFTDQIVNLITSLRIADVFDIAIVALIIYKVLTLIREA